MQPPLRYYQHEALWGPADETRSARHPGARDADRGPGIGPAFARGHRDVLLVMATGTGKTRTFTEIASRHVQKHGRAARVLVLAHRSELIAQAAAAFERAGLSVEIEQAERRARPVGDMWGSRSDAVVATVQTLKGQRLRRWPRDAFSFIITDEAHHYAAASYRQIREHFADALHLGVTATPDRGDGVGLECRRGGVKHGYTAVGYSYSIRDAIKEGFLAPVVSRVYEVEGLDISQVSTRGGDLAPGELETALNVDPVHHQIASVLTREAAGRKAVVFTAGVESAVRLATVLGPYVGADRVGYIHGEVPADLRAETLRRYAEGEIRVICNCAVLTEGWDDPDTSVVVIARPTKSRALYAQMVGRGTRLAPGKDHLLVVDLAGNAGRHQLVTPLDLLAGEELPDDVRQEAQREIDAGADVEAALEAAEKRAREREAREEAGRRRSRVAFQARYTSREVDPFEAISAEPAASRGPRATERQVDALGRLGIEVDPRALSRKQASSLLDRAVSRAKEGLATYRQAQWLIKHGLDPDVSKTTASEIMSAAAERGWRVTDEHRALYGREQTA